MADGAKGVGVVIALSCFSFRCRWLSRAGALKNPNGLFLGTPGSGKSFSAKREIVNVFLLTEDDIIIADPENEYGPLVQQFGSQGQVIDISPTSTNYINPMDINLDYSDDENPITLKSDFILSLCDLIIGGKEGLSPIERTIIDRCTRLDDSTLPA